MEASLQDGFKFLTTHVQSRLERSEHLFYQESEESAPFKYKYEARKILEELLKHPQLSSNEKNSSHITITIAIIYHGLGQNYFETEETSQAEKAFQNSLL